MLIYILFCIVTGAFSQGPGCVPESCERDLLDQLFNDDQGYTPSVFISPASASSFHDSCSRMQQFVFCVRNADPSCLETPLMKACIAVVEAACNLDAYFYHGAGDDSCIRTESEESPYKKCLSKAKAAAHTDSDDVQEQLCAIVTAPYLEFETCRLATFSNAGCADAVFAMQPYVQSILELQNEACKVCKTDCSIPRICDANLDCSIPVLMQESAATFKPYPPEAYDYEGACSEWQAFTNCRRQVDSRCLSTQFDQECFGVQASTCITAKKLSALGEDGSPKAFGTLDNLPFGEAKQVEASYESCREKAISDIKEGGLPELVQLCRVPGIYFEFEECRTKVFQSANLFRELNILYRYKYKDSIYECQRANCIEFCGGLEKTFCPKHLV